MPFTMRQLLAWPLARRAALVLAIGAVLGFAAPFSGDPPLSPPVRYAFWIGMVAVGYAAVLAAVRLLPKTLMSNPALRLTVAAVASALPVTFVAAWVIPFVRPGHTYDLPQLLVLFSAVVVVQVAIAFTLARQPAAQPRPALAASGSTPDPVSRSLLSRVPRRLGKDIVALEAEDHYVRVHTTLGSDLILMRLSDAVAAIEPDLGLQVHRSWWVADDAICEIVRSDQRSQLRLSNGLVVPVGPTYSAAVRSRVARLQTGR